MACAGIDIGSVNTAVVILDHDVILFNIVVKSDENAIKPRYIMDSVLEKAGLGWGNIAAIIATGRGRGSCDFTDGQSSDVICQSRGTVWLFPSARTIINLGAETSRVISLNDNDRVNSFVTNDKCAAGSGLFLESMAQLMGIPIDVMGELALTAESAEAVSSRCAVFAESEVISHIHRGVAKERILAGLHIAVVDRIMDLINRITIKPDLVLTGGVAKNGAILKEIEQKLGMTVYLPSDPQIIGALGAALLAHDKINL